MERSRTGGGQKKIQVGAYSPKSENNSLIRYISWSLTCLDKHKHSNNILIGFVLTKLILPLSSTGFSPRNSNVRFFEHDPQVL